MRDLVNGGATGSDVRRPLAGGSAAGVRGRVPGLRPPRTAVVPSAAWLNGLRIRLHPRRELLTHRIIERQHIAIFRGHDDPLRLRIDVGPHPRNAPVPKRRSDGARMPESPTNAQQTLAV